MWKNTINKGDVDLTNWKYIKVTSVSLILGLIALYAFLSPIGIASPDGNPMLVLEVYAVLQLIVLIVFRPKMKKQNINYIFLTNIKQSGVHHVRP